MIFLFPIFLFLFSTPAFSMESDAILLPEVVAEGTRLRREQRSAVVFTEERLQREAGRPLGEILREAAGVDFVVGSSGRARLSLRGSSGSQVLVIIDGVKSNDPSTPDRLFDWTRIDVARIERIEILKGPQAVSYGSDGIGGVVLITTKRGQPGSSIRAEAGTENFYRANGLLAIPLHPNHSLRIQAMGKAIFNHAPGASASLTSSEIPKSSKEASAGFELASNWANTLHSRVQFEMRSAKDEIDAGAFDPDPNSVARIREIRSGLFFDGKYSNELDWKMLLSNLNFRRSYADDIDDLHPFSFESVYQGTNTRAEFQIHHVTSVMESVLGLEGVRESVKVDSLSVPPAFARDHQETAAVFAETSIPLGVQSGFSVDLGSRASQFSSFGSERSWKAGGSYRRNLLTIDFGISTGFKAPALYSLYDPQYGNSALKPERSVQLEAGMNARPASSSLIVLRIFQSRVRDRFGFDPISYRSLNVARADVEGAEFNFEQSFGSFIKLRPHLTYLNSRDRATDRALRDVAKWKGGAKIEFDPNERSSVVLSFFTKSGCASGPSAALPGYGRFDLSVNHRLTTQWLLLTRVENLFDRKYSEVRGYRTPGVTAYAGVEYSAP